MTHTEHFFDMELFESFSSSIIAPVILNLSIAAFFSSTILITCLDAIFSREKYFLLPIRFEHLKEDTHDCCFLQKAGKVVLMKSSLLDHACSLVYVQLVFRYCNFS